MDFCIYCKNNSLAFGKTEIKIGDKTIDINTTKCSKCHRFLISPKIQKEINNLALKKRINLSPSFIKSTYNEIESLSNKFKLRKEEFINICTSFYILEVTKIKNFKTLRESIIKSNYKKNKIKIKTPLKYQLFKKINLFTNVFNLKNESKVMEEAINFCFRLLGNKEELFNIDKRVKEELLISFKIGYK